LHNSGVMIDVRRRVWSRNGTAIDFAIWRGGGSLSGWSRRIRLFFSGLNEMSHWQTAAHQRRQTLDSCQSLLVAVNCRTRSFGLFRVFGSSAVMHSFRFPNVKCCGLRACLEAGPQEL